MTTAQDHIRAVNLDQPNDGKSNLQLLKKALDATLSVRIKHDKQQQALAARTGDYKIRMIRWAGPIDLTRSYLESVIDDPVKRALQAQVKKLGQVLFNMTGSTDGMRNIGEEVADMDKRHSNYRSMLLDKGWDGVGSDADRWWC